MVSVDVWHDVWYFSIDCTVTCAHLPAGSQHSGMIPTQSEPPLPLEHVSSVFLTVANSRLFELFVFFVVALLTVLQCYISSRSLVGQRWCLRWCSVFFVWLECYMRSSACWIATMWPDTYALWDSSAFRECFISFLDRCRFLFVWHVCPLTGPRALCITVVLYSEILGWSALMFDVRIGNFQLTALLCALICLLDRDTVAWYPFSLIFLHFFELIYYFQWNFAGFLLYDKLCFFLSPCSWYHSGVLIRNPWLINVDFWRDVW